MKFRAVILIAILLGGTYTIIQAKNDYQEKVFAELLESMNDHFISLTFNKPSRFGYPSEVWATEDEIVVGNLLNFLQDYQIRKLKPQESPLSSETEQLSLILETKYGDELTIMVEENFIVLNSLFYYEIINGPLEADWIIEFFDNNQLSNR